MPNAPVAAGTTSGPVHAVPCSHCGQPNDARELEAQTILEAGASMLCDHCNRPSLIVQVRKVTLVVLRQKA